MKLRFVKYQGAGNDFVLVDGLRRPVPDLGPVRAARLCDRHFGVGADGVLLALPADDADLRMRVVNADGSIAEMCGNGIRCVAKWAADEGLCKGDVVRIATGRGVLACEVRRGPRGTADTVRVDMGAPILDRREVPMAGAPGRHVDAPVDLGGREPLRLTAVSMGNPHAVVFTDAQPTGEAATDLSRRVLAAGLFPRGVNLELARIRADGSVDVVVHERGVGLTLACGTGACAVAVGGALGGRLPYGREVPVHLPGGTLHIEVPEALDAVFMRGPAERVFDGEADLA